MKSRIALAVIAALATVPVHADDRTGFYWGFDLGQSSWGLDANDLDSQLADELAAQDFDVLDSASETSEDGFTWGLTLGYQIWRFLAVEAAYVDLGEAEYKTDVVVSDGLGTYEAGAKVNTDSSGAAVSVLGILPLWSSNWDVYGRAGMYFGSNDVSVRLTEDGFTGSGSDSSSSQSFMWGVGVGYTRGQWTSRLEYQQYTDVGDDDGLGEVDVDRIVFSAIYRTGFGYHRNVSDAAAAPVVTAAPVAVAAAAPAAPADSDGDGVSDASDQCPNTPRGERVGPYGCSCDVSVQLQFGFDSAELTADDRAVLDGVAKRLNELQFVGGEVAGHTDSTGDDAYNLDLSKRRAQSALDYLAAKGVAPGRMAAAGYGEAHPIADNGTEEGRVQNRRVVIRRTDCEATR